MHIQIPVAHLAPANPGDFVRKQNTCSLRISVEYTNFTKIPVYVKTQNGVTICLEPNQTADSPVESREHVEITATYALSGASTVYETMIIMKRLVEKQASTNIDAEAINKALHSLFRENSSRNSKYSFTFSIHRRLYADEITKCKCAYIREYDAMVTFDHALILNPHPNTPEGEQLTDYVNDKALQKMAGVFVRVIDNDVIALQRYYFAGKSLITVPSSRDKTAENGVYVTISTAGADGFIEPQPIFMSFKEAEERIGLYKSQEDALSHGNPELLTTLASAAAAAENSRIKLENEKAKAEYEMLRERQRHEHESQMNTVELELLRYKREFQDLQHANAKLKESITLNKDIRDDSIHARKVQREDHSLNRDDYYDRIGQEREDYFRMRKYIAEQRRLERDDEYEERSTRRKDSSEILKWAPGIAVGLLGLFAYVKASN